jgi:tetratricopeptide (TPR) repeat protein
MIRMLRIAAVIVVFACGVPRSSARSPSTKSNAPGPHEEAAQLNETVVRLTREGKYREAVAPAERALALREKALGPNHPAIAESLNRLAEVYRAQGAYTKAEPLHTRALDIREKVLGPNHPDVAESLNNLASLYEDQGAYAKAEPLHTRALDIREKVLGPNHPDVAESLNNLGLLYQDQGAYDRAEPLSARALAIREKVLGPNHPDVAESLNNVAALYQSQGMYANAEPLYTRALTIREKALGPSHPDIAQSLNNLAALYKTQGMYTKAEPLYARALDIFEKALGPHHPHVAVCLNNLAGLYGDKGAYTNAEPLHLRALDIFEKTLGPNHPHVAASLSSLAGLYWDQGVYAKAEPLYARALDILEKALGSNHPDVANSLNNLALLYWAQGAYARAESLYARALDIRGKVLGANHPAVASSLNNLAALYQARGAYAKAESLYARALDIREKVLGANHPDVASSLNNLAVLYWDQGVYARVEPFLVRALDIHEKVVGRNHPIVATGLNNLALLYGAQGAYAKAEPLLVRALDVVERALGPHHPDVAAKLNNLAALYRAQSAYAKAEPLLARAVDIAERQLRTELERLSEPRKRALMALLQNETKGLVSFHADAVPGSDSSLELALTTVLRRKGRIVDSLADGQTRLRAHLTPVLQQQLDQLARVRSELVDQLYAPASPSAAAHRDGIKALYTRMDELESALSAASDEFRIQVAPVTVAAVQAEIPADAALVEFVRYRRFDPRQSQRWQEERYVAYLLTRQGQPRSVALGEAKPIDAAVDAVLAAMDSRIPAATARAALRRLDAQLVAPIRAQLSGIAHLIIAPDGKLNLVPFEALIDSQGRYALDSYLVSYVSSGRDLLRLASPQRPQSSAVLIAGPDYGPVPRSPGPDQLTFSQLVGATAEAINLQRYFPTAAVTDKRATKAALAALTGPAMLHVATHGFYGWRAGLAGAASRGPDTRGPWLDPLRGHIGALPPLTHDLSDGLDQAGLAMADANRGPAGIVTAREIAGFDWTGTQLVVLSACQTGRGAVASGDGIYGLRRALVLAGAASQVVSLWSVADASTPALMRDYYAALQQGTGRAEALRQAKRRLRQRPGHAHPFYWAAFIPAGDWRPLGAKAFLPQGSMP